MSLACYKKWLFELARIEERDRGVTGSCSYVAHVAFR